MREHVAAIEVSPAIVYLGFSLSITIRLHTGRIEPFLTLAPAFWQNELAHWQNGTFIELREPPVYDSLGSAFISKTRSSVRPKPEHPVERQETLIFK